MRRLMLAIAVLALISGGVWAFLPRPVAVDVASIAPRSLDVAVTEEGEARIREVFTISATIGGKLRRIDLHAGDAVQAQDTVVAVIGPAAPALLDARARNVAEAARLAAQSAVDLALAQLGQAEAALEFSTAEAGRSRALFERSAISQRVMDTAILAQRTALAAFESAKANLAVRKRELESAEAVLGSNDPYGAEGCCVDIIAPVSGQVLRVLTENEQVVQPGTPIMEIGNPGKLEVTVDLLSRDAVRVRKGADAQITGWGGAPISALVARIEPSARTVVSALGIDEQRVRVILTLRGDPKDWQLLGHGFRVLAHINLWTGESVLSIPVGALFRDGSDWATYVVQDGQARLQIITLGERNESFAQVLSGVKAGDRVILHPSDLVADGVAVSSRPQGDGG